MNNDFATPTDGCRRSPAPRASRGRANARIVSKRPAAAERNGRGAVHETLTSTRGPQRSSAMLATSLCPMHPTETEISTERRRDRLAYHVVRRRATHASLADRVEQH